MKNKNVIKVPYQVVSKDQDSKHLHIKATYRNNFVELLYELKEVRGKLLWFGKIYIDGKVFWQSPESFGCETKEVLNDEIQHRLYTWALKEGYISHHKLAP